MSKAGDNIGERLADWRERGEDRLAPLRFHFLEVLSRRAGQQDGEPRRVLDERLIRHLQAYQDEVVEPARRLGPDDPEEQAPTAASVAKGVLAELPAYAARLSTGEAEGGYAPAEIERAKGLNLDPELIDYFRNTWARVSANGLLRRSQAQVPDNAGPLNSSSLAHRALMLMRDQSPGYLHHFLSYMDALSWMEQLNEDRNRVSVKPVAAGKRKVARRQP